jgi:hypothetical protein
MQVQVDLQDVYDKESQFLNGLRITPYVDGKSIVTTCYHKEVASMWVLLNELKRLSCQLPIEIFYRAGELTDDEIALLLDANNMARIKLIKGNPKDFVSRYGHTHGWACKIYALYESEFAENLWIDADNYPIVNPSFLFQDEEYVTKGSLFWRDQMSPDSANQYSDNSPMWPIFNVPINDSEPFEAGQLLINKIRCWQEFGLVKYYADNCQLYYHFGGDKETFKLAWQRMASIKGVSPLRINYHSSPNVTFGFMPYGPFHKGKPNQYNKWGGGTIMVQRDRQGNELFNHRNMDRFTLGDNTYSHDIANENYYHEHLTELKKRIGSLT